MFQDPLLQILFYLLLFVSALQLYFLLFVQLRLARYSSKNKAAKPNLPASVIVYTKNEIEYLQNHLPSILEQDYPDFEVVVVKDTACEETAAVLRSFCASNPHLKVVQVPEQDRYRRNKKFALSMGIKAAKNEHLVFTEVDSQPCSEHWLKEIMSNFDEQTEFVIAHVKYARLPRFLNLFFKYDSLMEAGDRLAYAAAGKAYAGDGRNMAYLKSVFFKAKGFASHMHIPLGEDQLFVNQHVNSKNTKIEIGSGAQVISFKQYDVMKYLQEKTDKMIISRSFKFMDQFKLRLQKSSGILFYATLISLLVLGFDWRILLSIYLFRTIVYAFVYAKLFHQLKYNQLRWFFPVLDFFYQFYLLLLSFMLLFKTKPQWK